jgi:hypothetical protein
MFPEMPIKPKTPITMATEISRRDASRDKGCFNCARLHTTCEDILSKMGRVACWRPEGTALIYDEVEE